MNPQRISPQPAVASAGLHRPRLAFGAVGLAAVLALGACASAPPPKEQMAVSSAAVSRVSGTAAEAPAEVAAAREKLALAQQALARQDYEAARQWAEQAEADAALAEARARANRSDAALGQVRDGIRALRAELARS
ncbi:MAG: DUF4398 domain-containing protein [Burkholderiaceae bacterium]|nr:DUF4398 domain-containing protein [Burkholderiaceae bacterium]